MYLQNWSLIPDVMVLRGEAFGRWLDYSVCVCVCGFLNGISALTKRLQRAPVLLLLILYKDTVRNGHVQPRRGPSIEPNYAGILILDFQPPELWEINFCCLLPAQSAVFCYSSPNQLDTPMPTVAIYAGRVIKWLEWVLGIFVFLGVFVTLQ